MIRDHTVTRRAPTAEERRALEKRTWSLGAVVTRTIFALFLGGGLGTLGSVLTYHGQLEFYRVPGTLPAAIVVGTLGAATGLLVAIMLPIYESEGNARKALKIGHVEEHAFRVVAAAPGPEIPCGEDFTQDSWFFDVGGAVLVLLDVGSCVKAAGGPRSKLVVVRLPGSREPFAVRLEGEPVSPEPPLAPDVWAVERAGNGALVPGGLAAVAKSLGAKG